MAMKLFRTIAIFDVIVAAEDGEDARNTLEDWMHGYNGTVERIRANEFTATEIRLENQVRPAMKDVKPIVGNALSDEDFAKIKGKTNMQAFALLHKK